MISAISSLTVTDVWYQVADTNPLGEANDPTGQTVQIAFTTGSDPEVSDWTNAAWEPDTITDDDGTWYLARVEVGPGTGRELAKDIYVLWLKIGTTDPTVLRGRTLHVY